MRIGILTFHKAPSCGAQLQAWALKTVLEDFGHQVSFPDCSQMGTFDRRWPYSRQRQPGLWKCVRNGWKDFLDNAFSLGVFRPAMQAYDDFRRRNLPEGHAGVADFESVYDTLVYGSDQVWNPALTGSDSALFLGEGVSPKVRKVAYAVSVGDGIPTPENRERIAHASESFAAISVREGKVVDLIAKHCPAPPRVVADPTLLVSAGRYGKIASGYRLSSPYLYYYALYHCQAAYERAEALSRLLGLDLVYTPLYHYTRRGMPHKTIFGVSPGDFLSYIAGAECVLTDSFHGIALSIVNRKPFVAYQLVSSNVESRLSSLLERIDMRERLFPLGALSDFSAELLKKPLSGVSLAKLDAFVRESKDWIGQFIGK